MARQTALEVPQYRDHGPYRRRQDHLDRAMCALLYRSSTARAAEVHDGRRDDGLDGAGRERGITITSAATTAQWRDHRINIIDTPATSTSRSKWNAPLTRPRRRSRGVLRHWVVSTPSRDGLAPDGQRSVRIVHQQDGPRRLDFDNVVNMMRERLSAKAVPLIPLFAGDTFPRLLVDLVDMIGITAARTARRAPSSSRVRFRVTWVDAANEARFHLLGPWPSSTSSCSTTTSTKPFYVG